MRSTKAIARSHLDRQLAPMQNLTNLRRPARGWIRAVRQALGMSTIEMARRMGVSQSRISALEHGEEHGSIKLATLERAAEALGCHLVYAIVPNESLENAVQQQARRQAREQLAGVTHSMLLEDQTPDDDAIAEQVDELAADLIDHRGLWAS